MRQQKGKGITISCFLISLFLLAMFWFLIQVETKMSMVVCCHFQQLPLQKNKTKS